MSTRQLRISDPALFGSKLNELLGKNIQVVFNDSTAFTGKLITVNSSEIVLKNMLLKKTSRPISSIVEIYFDSVS